MSQTDAPTTFEQALKDLEEIVQRLEKGELLLEDALAAYEEGVRLSRYCQERLDEAERRVETLSEAVSQTSEPPESG